MSNSSTLILLYKFIIQGESLLILYFFSYKYFSYKYPSNDNKNNNISITFSYFKNNNLFLYNK